jgi:putative tricarboxylic transport membrane protein
VRWSWEGAILASVSLFYVAGARGFETGFIADPIGPRAFPVGIGLLAVLVGLSLFFTARGAPGEPMDAHARLRASLLAATLFVYWLLLEPLGFIVSTLVAMTVLVALFRGHVLHGLAFGLMVGVAVFFLFGYGLSLPLPMGRLFTGS